MYENSQSVFGISVHFAHVVNNNKIFFYLTSSVILLSTEGLWVSRHRQCGFSFSVDYFWLILPMSFICVCMCMCVYVCEHNHMYRFEDNLGCWSFLSPCLWQGFLSTTMSVRLAVCSYQGFSCLGLPFHCRSIGVTDAHYRVQLCMDSKVLNSDSHICPTNHILT